MRICGIDPGKTGALVCIEADERVRSAIPMPVLGKELDALAIDRWLREAHPTHAVMEEVNSHAMGRQSAFNFGQGLGVLKGLLAARLMPLVMVRPSEWQKGIGGRSGLEGKALKDVLIGEAQRRCPTLLPPEANYNVRSAYADAYLMACWRLAQFPKDTP